MSKELVRPITPDEIAAYNNVGVVHLKGILDLQFVNKLRRHLDSTVQTLDQSPAGYNFSQLVAAAQNGDFDELASHDGGQHEVAALAKYIEAMGDRYLQDEASGKGHFYVDTGTVARNRDYKLMLQRGILPKIAAAFLDSEKVNFFGEQVFVKEPGTKERTAFHQDASFFEVEGDQCCVMWIAVDPTNHETGTMQYIRGTHQDGKSYKANTFVSQTALPGSEGEELPDIEANPDQYDIISFDTEPGDIIIHNYKTVHGAGGNRSRYQPRRACSVRYAGDDMRFKSRPGAPAQLHHEKRLKDGEPLSGPDFPVVWRKPKIKDAA